MSVLTVKAMQLTSENGGVSLKIEMDKQSAVTAKKIVLAANARSQKGLAVDIDIKEHRNRRSSDANAYFHVLVNKIATKLNSSNEEIKTQLVLDYGSPDVDTNGDIVCLSVPENADITRYYRYAKYNGKRQIGGQSVKDYLAYKETHRMNTAEMARLIDGTISEAKALDIDTITPREIEILKQNWRER